MNYYLVMAKKMPFYLHSLISLINELKNPQSLGNLILGIKTRLNFKNGLSFVISQPIDALIAKETLIDDAYGLREESKLKRIIDVGAAFGDFSLYGNKLFPKAEIIAFEPNPDSFNLFNQNIKINKAKNIKSYQMAIGNEKTVVLHIGADNVQGSQIESPDRSRQVEVECRPLSKFIEGIVDLLKIDTEGAEMAVLSSIDEKQFSLVKKIVCEYHNHLVDDQDKKIVAYLKERHYKVRQVEDKYYPLIGYIIASS